MAIKIIELITSLDFGGTQKMLFETLKRINREKYQFIVVSLKGRGVYTQEIEELGIKVVNLGVNGGVSKFRLFLSLPIVFFKLLKILIKEKPQIVHSYLFQANILGRIAAKIVRVPAIICSLRVMDPRKYQIWLERITKNFVTLFIANSEILRQFSIFNAGINPEKIITIYNGIDSNRYSYLNPQSKREELGIKENDYLIGTIGRLDEQKGIEYLFKALKIIKEQIQNFKCLVVGNGRLRSKLEQLKVKLGIKENVILTGARTDANDLMAMFNLFVLPSLWEGLPNVLLEAMACEKPIIATNVGGVPELIENEKSGILVEPKDPNSLAKAIIELIKNKEKSKIVSQQARKRVEKFSLDKMVKEIEKIYDQQLGDQGRPYA